MEESEQDHAEQCERIKEDIRRIWKERRPNQIIHLVIKCRRKDDGTEVVDAGVGVEGQLGPAHFPATESSKKDALTKLLKNVERGLYE